jgi:hypothetical protein
MLLRRILRDIQVATCHYFGFGLFENACLNSFCVLSSCIYSKLPIVQLNLHFAQHDYWHLTFWVATCYPFLVAN